MVTQSDRNNNRLAELTDREREIVAKVATGATNQQIAVDLDISINTVKAHLRNIYAKLGVESRTEATLCAIQYGLVQLEEAPPEERAESSTAAAEQGKAPETVLAEWIRPLSWGQMAILALSLLAILVVALWPEHKTVIADAPTRLVDTPVDLQSEVQPSSSSRWQSLAQMPVPTSRFASVAVDGRILVIGGAERDGITSRVMAYDPVNDRWDYRASKPSPTANIGAAVINGRVFVPGGLLADGTLAATVEVYDPATDTWHTGPPMPQPLCAYALTTYGESLYVLGGWDGHRYLDTVYRLDTHKNTWNQEPPLESPRGFATAAVVKDRLYIVGGYDGTQDLALVQSRALSSNESAEGWITHTPMAARRAGHGMAVSQNTLYVVGGGWESSFVYNERYDVANDAWSTFESPLIGEWRNLGLAVAEARGGAFVFALGGWNGRHLGIVEGYQIFFPIYLSTIEKGR